MSHERQIYLEPTERGAALLINGAQIARIDIEADGEIIMKVIDNRDNLHRFQIVGPIATATATIVSGLKPLSRYAAVFDTPIGDARVIVWNDDVELSFRPSALEPWGASFTTQLRETEIK